MKPLLAALSLVALSGTLSGCNAAAVALALASQPALGPTRVSGTLQGATANVRIGCLTWVEQRRDGQLQGNLAFDLAREQAIAFERSTDAPGGQFALDVTPGPDVAEGTYALFAWEDLDGDGRYEAAQNERRAPEVYRLRGLATSQGLWTAEKLVFTDKRLSIEIADARGGLRFSFD